MAEYKEIKTKWYYDACTLDEAIYKDIVIEVTNKHNPKLAVLSYLALGEAYGNLFNKKGQDEMDAFTGFLQLLKNKKHIIVVGNDEIDEVLEKIRPFFDRASLTDSIHVATAIVNGCSNVLSGDRDINGIGKEKKEKIKKVAVRYGVSDFCITRLKL